MKYLEQFEEYKEFQGRTGTRTRGSDLAAPVTEAVRATAADPSELLEASYHSLRTAIANDLLTRIKSVSPRFFERLVLDLLVAMG
jgi:restriction system protein